MKLQTLEIRGFGRIIGRTLTFGPGLNVIYGPNEAGKSTIAAAVVASLYGLQRGDKERWRPWTSTPLYATALSYVTADGTTWEVRRDFDRDAKGVRVYDAAGNDAAARVGEGRSLVPGEAHLGISFDVFVQTACALQREVALDRSAAEDVSASLARALGGGPREDAAIGAIKRLDDALRKHVGTARATKNAPLRELKARETRERREAESARAALAALGELRERIAAARGERDRGRAAAADAERRTRTLRAGQLRARLEALREYRDELAHLQAERSRFDDVAGFEAEKVPPLDDAYHAWRRAQQVAEAAQGHVAEEALDAAECAELELRRADAGTLDDAAYAALRGAAGRAESAQAKAASAAIDAAASRRDGDGGRALAGALVAAALTATAADIGVAIAHAWLATAVASVLAVVLAVAAFARAHNRAGRLRNAAEKQRAADAALADEHEAAEAVARVLHRLNVPTLEELVRRRERWSALEARAAMWGKAQGRALTALAAADEEGRRFDALAAALVPDAGTGRAELHAAALARAARRRVRDGLDNALAMSAMKRSTILGSEDEYALSAEFEALLAAGVEPAADPEGAAGAEAERAQLEARARDAERSVALLEGELRRAEAHVPDIAELDERLAQTAAEIARLEAFERAAGLARETIEMRKEEAHRAFARRLEEYSADVLAAITAGRYGEIRVDPATLAINVRVPETGALEELDRLSAGTRDQVALVVRFATARMFAEGLETPPLLLDDPFAFWDHERVGRCLPVLLEAAAGTQCLLFTSSPELAEAAAQAGATRVDLLEPALSA